MFSSYGVCRKSERVPSHAAQQAIIARNVRPRARCRAVRATLGLLGARIFMTDDASAVLHRVSYAAFTYDYECTYSKIKTSLMRVRFARSATGTHAGAAA